MRVLLMGDILGEKNNFLRGRSGTFRIHPRTQTNTKIVYEILCISTKILG